MHHLGFFFSTKPYNILYFWIIIKLKKNLLVLVRCSALHQIKSYDPQLEKFTVNSLDFRLCNITCQVGDLRVSFKHKTIFTYYFTSNPHRSGCGLLGLQIPFETHTLALQSQYDIAQSFRQSVIPCISTNFTFTYKVS
jgi:hypothetical protein